MSKIPSHISVPPKNWSADAKPSSAGKGDSPRNCFSDAYRANYDEIFRKKPDNVSEEACKCSGNCKDCKCHG